MTLSHIIKVDRGIPHPVSRCGAYSFSPFHPELLQQGPSEIDLLDLESISVPEKFRLQRKLPGIGWTEGRSAYLFLIENRLIHRTLNLCDALEIQKGGPTIFQRYFQDRRIPLWKSTHGSTETGNAMVIPVLQCHRNQVDWHYESLENIYDCKDLIVLLP